MTVKELYRDDLLNRYASHTFTETTVGDMTKVEFKDGSSAVIAERQTMDVDDAYRLIRYGLVGDASILTQLTTTQRDALTSTKDGCNLWNTTTSELNVCSGGVWKSTTKV